ncbi:hypothetical protein [Leptospira levettii]|uniref:Uncharacterized protein n=1 Tax=Leptospira levettii TaxID=2023178 RepID=A0AAW5VEG9_9LEPT|nr:hypothetical protein [Leptospira levettii]MCW7467803.1 hypothetical protein [Leptospira levettii]MCW7509757.1 hypothetical protein [Leptospira levettii]MCW7513435.1 hypothetical protein [Leptospira levettii]MCW7517179.1 hypothetical protein [Leptospira levettii]MCW7520844.1 hypothetical protein [Leptospira levettii]
MKIDDENEFQYIRVSKNRYRNSILTLSSMILFTLSAYIIYLNLSEEKYYIEKNEIQNEIMLAISNGSDLNSVKNIFDNRKIKKNNILNTSLLFKKDFEVYKEDVPLSKVFQDIRSSIFLNKNPDLKNLKKLDTIIKEYLERNPFDALEPNQKDIFENIRTKSENQYYKIQPEINKLSVELENKNSLVNKYLSQSNTSFWISIFGLAISLLIGIYQIYQGRHSKFYSSIREALSDQKKENKNPENTTE